MSEDVWHDVIEGDTLWTLAARYYGDAHAYLRIYETNRDILTDPNVVIPGQRLRIIDPSPRERRTT